MEGRRKSILFSPTFSPYFASTLPPHLLHPPIHRHLNCCGSNKKGGSKICFHLLKTPKFYRNLLVSTVIPRTRHINRLVQFSHIFELTLAAEQANMKLRSGTHHPAENLKTLARKELMRREVARQSPVNLLVTQLLGMLIQPQRFNFDGTYLILQHLVGTKLDALQLNLGGFSFGRSGHRLRAR